MRRAPCAVRDGWQRWSTGERLGEEEEEEEVREEEWWVVVVVVVVVVA